MSIELIIAIIFFATAGVNYLAPHRYLQIVAGLSGIIVAVLLLIGRGA